MNHLFYEVECPSCKQWNTIYSNTKQRLYLYINAIHMNEKDDWLAKFLKEEDYLSYYNNWHTFDVFILSKLYRNSLTQYHNEKYYNIYSFPFDHCIHMECYALLIPDQMEMKRLRMINFNDLTIPHELIKLIVDYL